MASFIAKQMLGNQLDSVKGAMGNKEEEGEKGAGGMDPEVAEALREAEERRQEKHRKIEEEREDMRQGIRDKYNIKKKENPMEDPFAAGAGGDGRLGRKRKTPEEIEAEAQRAEEEAESLTRFLPAPMREMANKVTESSGKLVNDAQEKCSLM